MPSGERARETEDLEAKRPWICGGAKWVWRAYFGFIFGLIFLAIEFILIVFANDGFGDVEKIIEATKDCTKRNENAEEEPEENPWRRHCNGQ